MKHPFSRVLETLPSSGIRAFFDLVIDTPNIISLGVGEPDFVTPWKIRADSIQSIEEGQTSYTSNKGMPKLLECISLYLETLDCYYDKDTEILVTNGVSEAIDLSLRAILNPEDEVILPQPNYVCYTPLIKLAGGIVKEVDTSRSEFIPTIESIKKAITKKTKAIILCSPNNPTGKVIPKKTITEIVKLAKKHDFWILADEIYAELTYDKEFVSIGSIPTAKERLILLNGFSKSFAMTGWRVGYIAAPTPLIHHALKIHQYSALCSPITSQVAAITALKQAPRYIKLMKDTYKERRELCISAFKEMGLETPYPDGAFYCFPSIKNTKLTDIEFATQLLEEEKVAVVPGSAFGPGGETHIRCCYATKTEDLKKALSRIKNFISKRRNK